MYSDIVRKYLDVTQGILSGYHTEIVSAFYRGYSGYQTGNMVVIIRGIDCHNNIVSSLLSEVFLAQFKLNHKQPNVHNNPHFPVTLRRITNTYDNHFIFLYDNLFIFPYDNHHIPRMIGTIYPYDNHYIPFMITTSYSLYNNHYIPL